MGEIETKTKVLKNGAVYDLERKRIVSGAVLSSADAAQMASRKQERKREAIARGANAVVAEGGKFDGTDLDFVEAIAEAQAIKALNPDDPKSTDAARFLLQEAGLAEKRDAGAQVADIMDANANVLRELSRLAAQIQPANGIDNSNYRKHDVIDVEPDAGEQGEQGDE